MQTQHQLACSHKLATKGNHYQLAINLHCSNRICPRIFQIILQVLQYKVLPVFQLKCQPSLAFLSPLYQTVVNLLVCKTCPQFHRLPLTVASHQITMLLHKGRCRVGSSHKLTCSNSPKTNLFINHNRSSTKCSSKSCNILHFFNLICSSSSSNHYCSKTRCNLLSSL